MIMLIDTLGERYGVLPSEVIRRANTFDVFVADTAIGFRNMQQDRAMNSGKPIDPGSYQQEELLQMVKDSRGES
jgi:hypothetical protein